MSNLLSCRLVANIAASSEREGATTAAARPSMWTTRLALKNSCRLWGALGPEGSRGPSPVWLADDGRAEALAVEEEVEAPGGATNAMFLVGEIA